MIETPTNHWKLGLFVVTAAVALFAALTVFGAQHLARETVPRVSYFEESVQGLDVGSPVKFRGVTIGKVSAISFAPDRVLVQVKAELYVDVLERIGLSSVDDPIGRETGSLSARNLRIQLSRSGITGIAYLEADLFDPEEYPPMELDFEPPPNYIPSVRSTLKGLEQNLAETLDELPTAIRSARRLLDRVRGVLDEVDAAGLQADLRRLLETAQVRLDELDLSRGGAAIAEAESTLVELGELLARLDDDSGPLQRALVAFEEVAIGLREGVEAAAVADTAGTVRDAANLVSREGARISVDAQGALEELRTTLAALRALVELLERDPSALVRGREGR